MEAVYSAVQAQQVVPVEQLQRERYKLQNQEYKYFVGKATTQHITAVTATEAPSAANKDRLPALPDLSDNSGGLSNPVYFNFVSYILWKAVARHLPTPEQRTAFCSAVGEQLVLALMPTAQQQLYAAAHSGQGPGSSSSSAVRQAPAAAVLGALEQLLQQLQRGGYICSYQLVWGSQPGGWPGDWATSQDQLVDAQEVLQQQAQPIPPGSVFQLKLQQLADLEGSVALRSEEDGFWSRHVSSMVAALLHAGGYTPVVDEYFYQDVWTGPQGLGDKLLLLFGDPLQQVDVPWYPTTLVQNWAV